MYVRYSVVHLALTVLEIAVFRLKIVRIVSPKLRQTYALQNEILFGAFSLNYSAETPVTAEGASPRNREKE